MKLLMLKGLPASGKSTFARELVSAPHGTPWKRVNKDDLRFMIDDGNWSKNNEKFIIQVRDNIITDALRSGFSVVVDDTNFEPKHEDALRKIAEVVQAEVHPKQIEFEVKFFEVSLQEAIRRDLKRPQSVGESVIRGMFERYLVPRVDPVTQTFDPALPTAIVCDIDGTLAHHFGRSPFEWHRVGEDVLDEAVRDVLVRYYHSMVKPVIGSLSLCLPSGPPQPLNETHVLMLSGRDAVCRPETEEWLARHQIKYDGLFMRPANDNRKDSIVKRELFEQNIAGKYNVLFILDDRDQVVNMWRDELGLKVFQVAKGSF